LKSATDLFVSLQGSQFVVQDSEHHRETAAQLAADVPLPDPQVAGAGCGCGVSFDLNVDAI
jgi:hypothetical protein